MRLYLRAQFNLGIVLPGYYSTEAVAVFQLTTMGRGASLQVSTMYKCVLYERYIQNHGDPPHSGLIPFESIKVSQARFIINIQSCFHKSLGSMAGECS